MTRSRIVPAFPESGEDWSADDPALDAALAAHLPPGARAEAGKRLRALGRAAPAEIDRHARLADRHRPVLHRRSAEGERVDAIEFHPSYRELQRLAREHEVFTRAWHGGSRVEGFALGYLYAQAECGYYCPACMTDGAAFVLSRHAPPALRDAYVPKLVSRTLADAHEGAMYLTEKGGGSDVGGATETTARHAPDGTWRLTGEKWFASNCVADVALAFARMTANAPGSSGLGLFLVPRRLADGRPNPGLRIERLKDKLGVTSMPTGEVLLEDAHAHLVAPDGGPGFRAMMEMVNLSRLYNAVASVAVAERALREARRAGRHRVAFGKPLREQPLFLREVLALTVDVEGALAFTLDVADLFERSAAGDAEAGAALRMLTPCAKAETGLLAVRAASAACELLGGVGYVEEYVTPRLLRDAQVLPIWEGTTNVQRLELLRVALKEDSLLAVLARSRAALEAAKAAAPRAREAAEAALDRLARECRALHRLAPAARELAAARLLPLAYHAHATASLARLAGGNVHAERMARVADLYAARHLLAGDEGARALDAAVVDGAGASVAFPTARSALDEA